MPPESIEDVTAPLIPRAAARRRLAWSWLCLPLLAPFGTPAPANESAAAAPAVERAVTLETVGQLGGPSLALALRGTRLYLGVGPALWVFDVAVPDTPVLLGQSPYLGETIQDVAMHGDLALVALDQRGLGVLDVHDPARPRITATFDTPGRALGLATAGDVAYLADVDGLRLVSLARPDRPAELSFVPLPCCAENVAAARGMAYVAAGPAGLLAIDVADPVRPRLVGGVETPGMARQLAVEGDYIYVNASGSGLRVIDIAIPASPREVGAARAPLQGINLAVLGHKVYVADEAHGVKVFDVSSPRQPRYIPQSRDPRDELANLQPATDVVAAMDRLGATRVFAALYAPDRLDVAGARAADADPFYSREMHTAVFGASVAPGAGFAYAVGEQVVRGYGEARWGVWAVDIADPSAPRQTGYLRLPTQAAHVAFAEGRVWATYVGNSQETTARGGVSVFDTVDPSRPADLGTVRLDATHAGPMGLAAEGTTAFAAARRETGASIEVLDLSPATSLRNRASFHLAQAASPGAIAAAGRRLFVAVDALGDGEGRHLDVLDASDPARLTAMARLELTRSIRSLHVDGSLLFATLGAPQGTGAHDLQVIDVADPADPRMIGRTSLPKRGLGVTVVDRVAYVANGVDGVTIIDVADPARPRVLGEHRTFGPASGIAARDGVLVVTAPRASFTVLRPRVATRATAPPPPTATIPPPSPTPPTAPAPDPSATPAPSSTTAAPTHPATTAPTRRRVWLPAVWRS